MCSPFGALSDALQLLALRGIELVDVPGCACKIKLGRAAADACLMQRCFGKSSSIEVPNNQSRITQAAGAGGFLLYCTALWPCS